MEPVNNPINKHSPIWWNVMFLPQPQSNWWDFFMPHWARHVLCYGWCVHAKAWVVVNPTLEKTFVMVLSDMAFDEYFNGLDVDNATILQVKGGKSGFFDQRILQTCSTVVARVIGIKGPALTPFMLYKRLRAVNATIKADPFNVSKSRSPGRRS